MKFSIVTPSFNQAKYIETTIRSVVGQSYQNLEYIVKDGGSTDGTQKVIEKYAPSLKKYISKSDGGQADGINEGFKYADGDIFAYLNSDDYYFEDTLKRVANIFENHPNVDVVYGDCVYVDENGQFIRYFSEIEEFDRDRLLCNSDYIMQPATFWRKTVFDEYGPFNKDLHYGFDWAFWCELAKNNCNFFRLNEVLAANREYDDTKTLSGGRQRLKELKSINQKYKTSILPHAYFGFLATAFSSRRKPGFYQSLGKFCFRILGIKNVIFNFFNAKKRVINGVHPYSGFLNKRAIIKIPCYQPYSAIRIRLTTPGFYSQSVFIQSKNKIFGQYEFEGSDLDMELDMEGLRGDIEIDMKFEVEYDAPIPLISRIKNFHYRMGISAQLQRFDILYPCS